MSDLLKAIQSLGDKIDNLKSAAEKKVTQTDEQAVKTEVSHARDRATPDRTVEQKAVADAELEAKIGAALERIAEKNREIANERRSMPSLADVKGNLANSAGLLKVETKHLFNRIGAEKARNSDAYREQYQGRHPLDIVMRGAWEVKETKHFDRGSGTVSMWATDRPLIAGDDEVVRNAWDANDAAYLWMLGMRARGFNAQWEQCPFIPWYRQAMAALGKALDTTDWANFVPTGFSAAVIEAYEMARNLTRYIDTFVMPRNPFDLPAMGARTATYKVSENTADYEAATRVSTSDPEDLKVTLSLFDFAVRTEFSVNVDQDSIVPVLDRCRREIARSWAYALESAILNSDSRAWGSHMDTGAGYTASSPETSWDGLRRLALANSYTYSAGAALTTAVLNATMQSMDKFASIPAEGFWVSGPKMQISLLDLKDANNNPVVVGSAFTGAQPGVISIDSVDQVYRRPWCGSAAFSESLTSAGIYDASTTTKKSLLYVNRRGPVLAFLNEAPEFYTRVLEDTLQHRIVVHWRREFEDQLAIASNRWVTAAINIS